MVCDDISFTNNNAMTVHFVYADLITNSYLRLPYLIFHMVGTVAILKVWFIALRLVWVKKKKENYLKLASQTATEEKNVVL